MPRAVPEWIGKTPNATPPMRVKLRVWDRCIGRCIECSRKLLPGMVQEYDHIVAIINGGENKESNLQLLCEICHLHKTGADVAEKSMIYEKRLKHTGIKKSRGSFATNKSGKFKRKIDGTVVRR